MPSFIKSKQETGKYFSDSRVFVSKAQGNGNIFNRHHPVGFFFILLIGLVLLVGSI
ncbi:hypothetical protein RV18_GL001923 [Enterococcus termitis]|nr:hypothetical protein RV18_GL001923 [Enterococcus termitis]